MTSPEFKRMGSEVTHIDLVIKYSSGKVCDNREYLGRAIFRQAQRNRRRCVVYVTAR